MTVLNELRNSVVRERGQWNEERKRLAEEWGEERKRWDEERKRVAEERVEERKDMNLEKANWRDSLEQARLLCESRMDALWKNAEEERGRMLGWWREEMEKEKQEIREGMEREREGMERERVGWERERVEWKRVKEGWERERKGWESERSALRVHLSLPRERSLNDGGEA